MLEHVSVEAPVGNVVTLHDRAQLAAGTLHAALVSAEGLIGLPGMRQQQRDRTEGHGGVDRSRFVNPRGPSFEGELWGANHDAAYALHDALERALWAMADAPGILRYRRQGAAQQMLRALVKPGTYDCPLAGAARLLRYQLQFSQPDPRAYSDVPLTIIGAAPSTGGGGLMFPFMLPLPFQSSGGGIAQVTNTGTAPAPLIIRAYGRAVSPRIRLVETGEEIVLTGEIGAGTFYEIDTGSPSIRAGGTTSRMEQLDAAASTFFEAPALSTVNLQLLASDWDAGAHLEVDVRSAVGG